MHRLSERLSKIERQRPSTEPQVIIISGGLCALDDTHACVGGGTIERDRAEPFPAFQARTLAAAKAAGEAFVVIGGLHAQDDREIQLSGV
jgi:hypothetical protein